MVTEISRLTDKGLRALKPKEKYYRITVKSHQGLALRIEPTGLISFRYRYQLGGVRREMTIGAYPTLTLQELLAKYSTHHLQVKQGTDPLLSTATDDPLFKNFVERYITQAAKKLKPSSLQEYTRQIRRTLIPAWGNRKLSTIHKTHIYDLIEAISNTAPVQANRTLATIKAIFSYATDIGLMDLSPAYRVKPPSVERPRERFLDLPEIVKLFEILDACPNRDTVDLVKLILFMAQRPGEVRTIHRNKLKRDDKGLWLQLAGANTKNSRPNRIFINTQAERVITDRINDLKLDGNLFPAKTKEGVIMVDGVSSRFRTLRGKGVDNFNAHDLRRTATTLLASLGYRSLTDDITNHTVKGITRQVYDLYDSAAEIKEAMTALGNHIETTVSSKNSNIIPFSRFKE